MAKRLGWMLPVLIVAAGAVVTVIIVRSKPAVEREEPQVVAPLVRVQPVRPQEAALTVRSQGTAQPSTSATLVAEVAGKVLGVSPSFAAGGFFRQGEALVRLDPRDYELAVTRAESQLAQANVRLKQVQAEAEIAREEWKELEGDRPAPPLVKREPQLAEAEAAVAAAQAALQEAELRLDRTVIRAPYAGRVRAKQADVGQYVTPGQPVGSIYAVDYAEVRLPVPDGELAFLDLPLGFQGDGRKGPPVTLSAEFAGKTHQWQGHVARTEGEIDPATRMVQLVARVDDPYGRGQSSSASRPPLAAGMFVEAQIQGPRRPGIVTLPRTALREGTGDQERVMVFEEDPPPPGSNVERDGVLHFRDVDVLRVSGTEVLIAEGLQAGDKVCVSPLEAPVDGMAVRIVEEEGGTPEVGGTSGAEEADGAPEEGGTSGEGEAEASVSARKEGAFEVGGTSGTSGGEGAERAPEEGGTSREATP